MYKRAPGEPREHPMVAAALAQNTPVTQWDGRLSAMAGCVRRLRGKLLDEGFSVLHSHEYKTDLIAALALGKRRRPALIATVRHTEPGLQMALFQTLDSVVLHRFGWLVTPSQGALSELRSWPRLLRKTRVIYHGVDPLPYGGRAAKPSARNGGPVISIVARLDAVKGHDIFLRSARLVLSKRPDARFWIAGDGRLRPALEAETRRLGLTDAVTFLGYRTDAEAVMAASDIVVCSSRYEACPRFLLEALALGRPVVAPAVGGIPEIVRDGETGILAPAGDPQALADGILRLLNDPPLALRLGEAGRDFVRERFTFEAQAAALAGLYREAI